MQHRLGRHAYGDEIWRIQRQGEDARGCWVYECSNGAGTAAVTAQHSSINSKEHHRSEIRSRCLGPERQDALARRTGDAAPTKCVLYGSHHMRRSGRNLARLGLPSGASVTLLTPLPATPGFANYMTIPGGWITGVALKLPSAFPSTGPAAGVSLAICGVETPDGSGSGHGEEDRWMIREAGAAVDQRD
ncbi:hypothetical protein V493_05346 [Pseudogymnoascus sp. VKM F-4281 (FW-2241)]|nr:hypothetical protein V493_05346 [Pseudogymnoascus sp. VKM F-4281 (FW-2241)]